MDIGREGGGPAQPEQAVSPPRRFATQKEAGMYAANLRGDARVRRVTGNDGKPAWEVTQRESHAVLDRPEMTPDDLTPDERAKFEAWKRGETPTGAHIENSSRDMFVPTRGDRGSEHGQDQTRNGRQDADFGHSGASGMEQGAGGRRDDASPELVRRGESAVDAIVRRFGGTVLGDSIARDFKEHDTAQLIGKTVREPQDLAAIAAVYRNPIFETVHYIFVDANGRVVAESAVSSRLPASSAPFPKDGSPAWISAMAKAHDAKGLWLLHNHPSGIPRHLHTWQSPYVTVRFLTCQPCDGIDSART